MQLHWCTNSDKEKIAEYMSESPFLSYKEYGIHSDLFKNLIINELADMSNYKILSLMDQGKIRGVITLQKLDWDSNFFELPMYKIDYFVINEKDPSKKNYYAKLLLSNIIDSFLGDVPHISLSIYTEEIPIIHALLDYNFKIMNTIVTYCFEYDKKKVQSIDSPCLIRPFKREEISQLAQIAKESFSVANIATNGFFADPSLPKLKLADFHSTWVTNSCNGLVDEVLVADIEGVPAGFTTLKKQEKINKFLNKKIDIMILSAVSNKTRKKGIYTSMINAGLKYFEGKSDVVEVGTEVANFPVQKAWVKLGFSILRSNYAMSRSTTTINYR